MSMAAAPGMATSPNAGVPLELRRRAHDAIAAGKDMTPEDWRGLVGSLVKFFGEEAEEPEHAEDERGWSQDAEFNEGDHPRGENGRFGMSASHPSGKGPKFSAKAGSHEEVERHMGVLRKSHPEHNVTVQNHKSGMVHTFKPSEKYNKDYVDDAAAADAEGGIAAGTIFCDPEGAILLLKRSPTEENYAGHWALPGGKADAGETAEDAADREATEEIGPVPEGEKKLVSSVKTPNGMMFHTFHQHVPQRFMPKINGEHSDYLWRTLDNLPEPLHPGVANVLGAMASGQDQAADESIDSVEIDRDHDGPWMSCMSVDGGRMYRNKNLPDTVDIDGKTVIVDDMLVRHEKAERDDLEELIKIFKSVHAREPDEDERKAIYLKAHKRSGTPAEKAYAKKIGVDWERWSAWCRGEETRVEKGPFTNQPQDADVKPIPHGHGDLAATDSVLRIALDRDSVREKDKDGRLRVETANISKACVNPYAGHEIPNYEEMGLDPNKIYKLLRDPAELKKAATSFNGVQLLKKHIPVSAEDGQKWDVVGTTGSEAKFDEPFLTNSLFVWTQDGIDLIESDAQKELSCGYHYKPDMTPGVFDGTPYDGVMREIVGNHVALVKDGRAGPDVVVGDSTENLPMTKPTRFAATALQLTACALAPILAKDHKLDILPLFKDLTSKNFKTQKPVILAGIKTAAKGQLAMDADPNMGHVAQMLDSIEGMAAGSADESVSPEQHKAMEAAAHGESNLGISPKVGKEFTSKDASMEGLKGYLKEKGVGDDVIGGACDMVSGMMPPNALDAEETDEEKAEREKKEKEAKDAKTAKDAEVEKEAAAAKRDAEGEDEEKVTKPAMDAAIKAATELTAKRVKDEVMANQRAIATAHQAVRPYVGELTMTFDSADEVYKTALTMRASEMPGVDVKAIHPSAYPALLKMLKPAGARSAVDRLGADSALTAGAMSFAERHPEAARITQA